MAVAGEVFACKSRQHFDDHVDKSKNPGKLIVVDFTATWCGPCKFIAPIFAELAKKFTDVIFLKVDVDELQDVAQKWEVEAMPTFLILKDGEKVDKVVGADKTGLERTIAQHAGASASA